MGIQKRNFRTIFFGPKIVPVFGLFALVAGQNGLVFFNKRKKPSQTSNIYFYSSKGRHFALIRVVGMLLAKRIHIKR